MRKAGVLIGRALLAAVVTAGVTFIFVQNAVSSPTGPITTAICTDSTTGCRPGANVSATITAFTNCKNITSTKDLFIPTKIQLEWTDFLNWAANNTNTVAPPASCGCPVNACTTWGSCSAACGSGTQTCTASATPQCIGTTQSCTGTTPVDASCAGGWLGCSGDTGLLACQAQVGPACGGAGPPPCCIPDGEPCCLHCCAGWCVGSVCGTGYGAPNNNN